ncbi:MAG: PAS domain-containing protein, partial [Bacteroidia bacterium]
VFVNPKFTETTGYTFEEVKGQNPRILNTGHTSKSKYSDLWQTILAGNNWHGEFKNKKKNGEFYWERAFISPVKNEAGEITNFLAVKEDITEQKIAEEAFQKNVRELEDYKFAIDESAIVTITNKEGLITYANHNFSKISQYSIDEIIGQNHRLVNSGYHPKEYFTNMWSLITNGKVWIGELKNKAKDGSIYWVHGTIIPFLDEENKPFQYLSIRFDITERKKAEEGILESNERYNLVAKATNDSIWDLNILTHEIVRSGSGFEVLFGYKATDGNIDYSNYRNLIHPDDLERVIASKIKVFSNPNEFNWEQDYRFLKANGEYAFVHDKGFIIRDKNGKAIRMIGATQDVTEREKHVKAIEEQNSKLRDIAWIQSHVVRAPLSRMMGIVNLLNEVELNGEEFKEWVGHFNNSSAELDKVIHDISNKSDEFDLKFKK